MQSLNIVFIGKDEVRTEVQPVSEPRPRQLLVRSSCSLISTGTECICLQRKFEPGTHWHEWVQYPFSPGYSNVGTVVQVGSEVKEFKAGDRVATRTNHHQYVLAGEGESVLVPDGVSDADASWFHLAGIVQVGVRAAEHRLGDAVAVVGLGLLGQLVVQYVRVSGAREVVAIDMAQKRLDMALAHGATHGVQAGVGEALDTVKQATGGRLADVVYDVTGHAPVFAPSLPLARRFGTVVLLGDTGTPSEQRLTRDVVTRGLKIVGAHDGHPPAQAGDHLYWTHNNMTRLFFGYVQRGQMQVHDLVTHRFKPSDAADAYRLLTTDRDSAMGVLFDWQGVS